ncbi:MAG: phage tail spike protein [Clostridium celatum]|nr:phage tail spike protein [Clostridium celatum]
MYEVKIINDGNEAIINAVSISLEAPRLLSGVIKKGINTIDSFNFSMYMNNPGYYLIKPRKTLIKVFNTKRNKYEFIGRVLLQIPSMDSNGIFLSNFICESELGYLHDSKQRYGEYHNISVRDFLKLMLDTHNSCVEDYKRFELGIVEVMDSNNSLYRYLNYEDTFDMIKEKLIDRLGGELRVRYDENGIRYLDYLNAIGEKKETEIRLSKNLISIEQEKDPTDIIGKLVVLGPKLEDSEERITIKSVNNGLDYIIDEEAISEFGINEETVIYDNVTDPNNLLKKGKEYLNETNRIKVKYKIKALDLSNINLDIDSFEIGNVHPVSNMCMGIDDDLRIVEVSIDINEPQNSDLSIGDKFEDIKTYNLKSLNTAKEVEGVKTTLKTSINVMNSISNELSNTIEVLDNTNKNVGDINEAVSINIEATKELANNINILNNSIENITLIVEQNSNAILTINENLKNINNKLNKINTRLIMGDF